MLRLRAVSLPMTGIVFLVVATVLVAGTVYRVGAQGQGTDPEAAADPGESTVTRAPATTPLRWRVPWVTVEITAVATGCGTAITVRNLADTTVNVEVEYFALLSG